MTRAFAVLVLGLLAGVAGSSHAQTPTPGTLRGRIVADDTGDAIRNARVSRSDTPAAPRSIARRQPKPTTLASTVCSAFRAATRSHHASRTAYRRRCARVTLTEGEKRSVNVRIVER